jgi:NTP pyrophosphatase (non-canonical NTP hydrolase)
LDFTVLRWANVTRCEVAFHPLEDWSPTDWMTAVAGEVGEAANYIKKMRRGEPIATEAIAKELADAVIYIDLLAARLGIDLGDAVVDKFNEVSDRVSSSIRLVAPEVVSNG